MDREFSLYIEMGNDTLMDRADISEILKQLSIDLNYKLNQDAGIIRDANGNKVGSWEFN